MKNKPKICIEAGAHEWDKDSIDWDTDTLSDLELRVTCKICGARAHLYGEWQFSRTLTDDEAGKLLFSMVRPSDKNDR